MGTPKEASLAYHAPGSVSSGAMRLPGHMGEGDPSHRIDPDDHLVEPESRQEVIDGRIIEVSPARPGHGDTHCRLDTAIHSGVAQGYVASSDLLTRRDRENDFATDTCVRKAGIDPDSGYRYLEELSFEVFHTQSRSKACKRARYVIASGVRRIFGLFVDPVSPAHEASSQVAITVEEWSPDNDQWVVLDSGDYIDDPCLACPLPVASLMEATALDDAVVRMYIAKRNPVIEKLKTMSRTKGFRDGRDQGLRDGRNQGFLDGKRKALFDVLALRSIALTSAERTRINACTDLARLDAWFARALSVQRANELFNHSDATEPRATHRTEKR